MVSDVLILAKVGSYKKRPFSQGRFYCYKNISISNGIRRVDSVALAGVFFTEVHATS